MVGGKFSQGIGSGKFKNHRSSVEDSGNGGWQLISSGGKFSMSDFWRGMTVEEV